MKIPLSFIFFFCFLSFQSCQESKPNQKTLTQKTDTGVLVAMNEQNPELESPNVNASPSILEKKEQKIEIEKSEPIAVSSKKELKEIPANVSKNDNQSEKEIEIEQITETAEIVEPDEQLEPETEITNTENEIIKDPTPTKTGELPKGSEFNHNTWNGLLREHVSSSGKVNYKGFKSDISTLNAYLKELENNPIQNNWSKAKKMAYWVNAYNAFTIKLIVDNYPVSSITKLHGGKPWDVKWIKLGEQTYSLNNIENDILRPKYKDARIHFAVNCAAQSCPPLLNQAWTESNLEQLFEKQAKAFINNPKFNTIKSKEVEISKIFEWYAVDFGNIIDYLNQYTNTPINKNAKVKYKEYNWALNE